ncbi:MAG: aminomethyltransferase family protein [Dehalococcoidia bacterium]
MNRSPLYETHRSAGAAFGQFFDWEMPSSFSSAEEEYRAAKERAALADRSYIGRLRMTGEDALDLLDRLSTNQVTLLPSGSGLSTVLTTNKGRVVDLVTVYSRGDYLILLTGPQNREKVISWIDRYSFGEEASLEDVTSSLVMLTLYGPRASAVLERLVGSSVAELAPHHGVAASHRGIELYIARDAGLWGEAYNILVPAQDAAPIWGSLLDKGEDIEMLLMGTEACEALRIEAGVPACGSELSEEVNPLEAGLNSSISFTKGCYVGQEVVARLNTYKKVKRYLVKLRFPEGPAPQPPAPLELEGKEVGVLTSVAALPGDGQSIALGYVRAAHARPGVELAAASGNGRAVGEIVGLAAD